MKMNILVLLIVSGINFCEIKANHFKKEDTALHKDLMKAIQDKQPPVDISCLIEEGADVNAVDFEFLRWEKPVLRYALDRGIDGESIEIIRMLIEAGADVNAITYNRVTDERVYGMMPLLMLPYIHRRT